LIVCGAALFVLLAGRSNSAVISWELGVNCAYVVLEDESFRTATFEELLPLCIGICDEVTVPDIEVVGLVEAAPEDAVVTVGDVDTALDPILTVETLMVREEEVLPNVPIVDNSLAASIDPSSNIAPMEDFI
jgi:hypothetical protein